MAKKKQTSTNAIRLLKASKVDFEVIEYEHEGEIGEDFGNQIALKTGLDPKITFKTLVLRGEKNGILVSCIPVNSELDLKKLAIVTKEKKVEMLHVKDLLENTGYIRGSVSPVGMKKKYPTYIDKSCLMYEKIAISAGVCGCTIVISPEDIINICSAVTEDIIK